MTQCWNLPDSDGGRPIQFSLRPVELGKVIFLEFLTDFRLETKIVSTERKFLVHGRDKAWQYRGSLIIYTFHSKPQMEWSAGHLTCMEQVYISHMIHYLSKISSTHVVGKLEGRRWQECRNSFHHPFSCLRARLLCCLSILEEARAFASPWTWENADIRELASTAQGEPLVTSYGVGKEIWSVSHNFTSANPALCSNQGPIVYIRILNKETIFLNSAKAVVDLMESRASIYSDRPRAWMTGELARRKLSIFRTSSADPRFRVLRRLLQDGLNPRAAKNYRQIQIDRKSVV